MGGAMAGRLCRAGFAVTVWNRTRATAEAVAGPIGARVAATPREAVAAVDIVLSSLADDAAVKDVYTGPYGAALLDAPVSGSVSFVEKGQLTVMVGGDPVALQRTRPVLDALSAKLFHVGDLGAGATMKLAVNALVHGINVALSEALVLAEKAGVTRSTAYDVFSAGAGAAPFVLYKRAAFEHPEETPVAFSLDLGAKDLDLILGLAARVAARMDQAVVNRATQRAAIAAGLGSRDISAIATFLRSRSPSASEQ